MVRLRKLNLRKLNKFNKKRGNKNEKKRYRMISRMRSTNTFAIRGSSPSPTR